MKKNKNKFTIFLLIFSSITFILTSLIYLYLNYNNNYPIIKNIEKSNNKLIIKFSKISNIYSPNSKCIIKENNSIPNINDNWEKINNNTCIFKIEKNKSYYIFLMNNLNNIKQINDKKNKYHLIKLNVNQEKIYLALNNEKQIEYSLLSYTTNEILKWTSSDEKIATIENGLVKGINNGNVTITAEIANIKKEIEVIVTDTITKIPKEFNTKKEYLPCNKFNEDEANLLDEILEYRINQVGGYNTRAAVVEAARFLTLEFPYRIKYFFENGRLTKTGTNYVDGEGRYYHKGLYLNENKIKDITASFEGPIIWGCPLTNYDDFGYEFHSGGKNPNGLDCSGFISWVLLNGGYDIGDYGADYTLDTPLIMDNEEIVHKITNDVIKNTKAGDLISYWGHIAIIIGIDDTNLYVAESLPEYGGVVIKTYNKNTVHNNFDFITYMDSIYKQNGNYTNMWY